MKKIFTTLLIATFALALNAQDYTRYMRINLLDGTTTKIAVNTIDSIDFITEDNLPNHPEHNGHEYVDLGLPSDTLWATCNVGATRPEEYGDYFAWGETEPKTNYDWSTYKFFEESGDILTKYCTRSDYGIVDNKTVLEASDDAATVNWGGSWRMPTDAEQRELRDNCTWAWTIFNGINGYRVTGKNNQSIFLPAAGIYNGSQRYSIETYGYYSSSALVGSQCNGYLYIGEDGSTVSYGYQRYTGKSVRPVCSSR